MQTPRCEHEVDISPIVDQCLLASLTRDSSSNYFFRLLFDAHSCFCWLPSHRVNDGETWRRPRSMDTQLDFRDQDLELIKLAQQLRFQASDKPFAAVSSKIQCDKHYDIVQEDLPRSLPNAPHRKLTPL